MKVAVFGCLHGMLDEMYLSVERYELTNKVNIDLILVCGDCQTIRHPDDLLCLSCPEKYKKMGDFHEYYSGKKTIPKLTIFVGGNHEASNYLMTLPYGGWVCDNFYYLGYAGVVRYRGLRIAGVSGIYSYHNCEKGRFERLPLNDQTIRSVYHTRRTDIFRLQLLSERAKEEDLLDVFLSHDWPLHIYEHGDWERLIRYKRWFKSDIDNKSLGNPLTKPLIRQLKPNRWFAAHLHCKFEAEVKHETEGRCTKFLSLNKIENRTNYMEILDITSTREHQDGFDNDLYYDPEWLTILRKTVNLETNSSNNVYCPTPEKDDSKPYFPTDEEIAETTELMNKSGGLKIKKNFKMVDPVVYNRPSSLPTSIDSHRRTNWPNYQTEELVDRIQLNACRSPPGTNIDDQNLKQENETKPVKREINTTMKTSPKIEPKSESTVVADDNADDMNLPPKKRTFPRKQSPIELDDDGCLPYYVDTKGDK